MKQPDSDDEVDVVEQTLNPLITPDKRFMLIAGLTLPVLIDRAGGSVTLSDKDAQEVHRRYGGRAAVRMEKTPDGAIRCWLVPSKKKAREAQA